MGVLMERLNGRPRSCLQRTMRDEKAEKDTKMFVTMVPARES